MFYRNGNGYPIVRKLQLVVLKETGKHWYEGKWYVLGHTVEHLKMRIQSYACSLSFLFLSCTLSWLYISIQLLFCSVFYNTVISISDSLQFDYRNVMATVILGLLHNEQGGCMENT